MAHINFRDLNGCPFACPIESPLSYLFQSCEDSFRVTTGGSTFCSKKTIFSFCDNIFNKCFALRMLELEEIDLACWLKAVSLTLWTVLTALGVESGDCTYNLLILTCTYLD